MSFKYEVGVIGIGNMGSALARGWLEKKTVENSKITIYDINKSLLDQRAGEFNVSKALNNTDLIQSSKYIILAVKPQVMDKVLDEIGSKATEEQTIISIAAGISIEFIEDYLKKNVGVIRVMPNTPALVAAGVSAMAYNENVEEKDRNYVKNLLSSVGLVVELEEKHIDAVTGLSGSGPAYIFIIIEALADGGVKMGLSRDIALKLAAQTVLGSAKMVIETGKHPGVLKDMVTSPGGTTITALHELEKGKLRSTLISAVEAATNKAKSLK